MIPEKVAVVQAGQTIKVKGPLGEVSKNFLPAITVAIATDTITLVPGRGGDTDALWGTYGSHLKNMIEGVVSGFTKKLVIEGVGYRASLSGNNLTFNLGFSHPVILAVPDGIKVAAEKNILTVTGVDKELVGRFAAMIRDLKPPEPYKGKGIHYETEVIRRKEGKKVVS